MFLQHVVRLIHLALITFIVIVPFTDNEWLLSLHAIGLPGLLIHWLTNNNMCSLTILESQLTGKPMDKTFIARILHPLFEVDNTMIYTLVFGLWFLTLYKLYPTNFRMIKFFLSVTWSYIYSWLIYLKEGISNYFL